MAQKYNPPAGAPPSYDGQSQISSPPPAHTSSPAPQSEYYGASPYQQNVQPYPNQYQDPHPPSAGYYGQPQMNQQGGGGYYPQQQVGYGPQGGYYNGGHASRYGPQGQYMDNRRGGSGFMEALLASLACCCCLDACLLF